MQTGGQSVEALALNRGVRAQVGLHLSRMGAEAVKHYDRCVPGLIDALGVDRSRYGVPAPTEVTAEPATPSAEATDWDALIAAAPRKGWWAWAQSQGVDPHEFKRRREERREISQ